MYSYARTAVREHKGRCFLHSLDGLQMIAVGPQRAVSGSGYTGNVTPSLTVSVGLLLSKMSGQLSHPQAQTEGLLATAAAPVGTITAAGSPAPNPHTQPWGGASVRKGFGAVPGRGAAPGADPVPDTFRKPLLSSGFLPKHLGQAAGPLGGAGHFR